MHVAMRYGRLRLTEVVRAVEGLRYQAAAQAVKRFSATLGRRPPEVRLTTKAPFVAYLMVRRTGEDLGNLRPSANSAVASR